MAKVPIPTRARVYLLCALFNLDPRHWPWQLQLNGGRGVRIHSPGGDVIRLGPNTPPDPTVSCFRAAALLDLATGNEAKALMLAGHIGLNENDLRETWTGILTRFADELRAIERRIERSIARDLRFEWPRSIRDLVHVGYLAHQVPDAWPLEVVDPDEIKKLDAATKPHPAAVAVLH